MWNTIAGAVGLGAVLAAVLEWVRRRQIAAERQTAAETSQRILEEARKEADHVRRDAQEQAKDFLRTARETNETEIREGREELRRREQSLASRETNLDRKAETLDEREKEARAMEAEVDRSRQQAVEKHREIDELRQHALEELEQISGLSRDDARRHLIESMTEEARHEAAKSIRQIEEQAREDAERRAKQVISIAIERYAGEFVAERTVSVVQLPSDDLKGRIIGREGRNIRAIESLTGVDLIVDDTPESVVVSCHNPIRREIAKMSLERLIADGRIHPGRIEEVVRRAEQDLDQIVREAGQKAVFDVGIHGVHPELVRLVGMLRFRYSYAQNVLQHSIETAFIAGAMAAELGLNEKQARRAGLLHDVGKALTHEVEGSHAIIGGEIARKYGESAKIVNAIAAHHEEVRAETILAPIVDAADALSGARPGARREVLESYVKRLEELERISTSFNGVEKAYAVQAGREIRVLVEPGKVNDDAAAMLARDVARKIEAEMTYPGQIKVTVIREMRASEVAH